MSVRRKIVSTGRKTLFRVCDTCGRNIVTTADTPWIRQVPKDGKKQAIVYYCSEKCYAASYKRIGWYDGKAEQRRREREAKRDTREKCRRYYAAHAEELREYARRRSAANPEAAAADRAYARKKRKLLDAVPL